MEIKGAKLLLESDKSTLDTVLDLTKKTLDNSVLWTRYDQEGARTIYNARTSECDFLVLDGDTPEEALLIIVKSNGDVIQAPKMYVTSSLARAILTQKYTSLPPTESEVSVAFDFPESVRVPCEQYLVYFAQFLKDAGINTSAELTHKAGMTLFTVTPMDKDAALDNIRQALELYLHLPHIQSPSAVDHSIATQRLIANIQMLNSQMRFANATLEAQRAALESKDAVIHGLQTIIPKAITPDVFVESVRAITSKEPSDNTVGTLNNTVLIQSVERQVIDIDLPEIFRRMKRFFATGNTPEDIKAIDNISKASED